MKASDIFFKIGLSAWLLGAGGTAVVFMLSWFDVVSTQGISWRMVWLICGVGGLGSIIVGGVLNIWRR